MGSAEARPAPEVKAAPDPGLVAARQLLQRPDAAPTGRPDPDEPWFRRHPLLLGLIGLVLLYLLLVRFGLAPNFADPDPDPNPDIELTVPEPPEPPEPPELPEPPPPPPPPPQ